MEKNQWKTKRSEEEWIWESLGEFQSENDEESVGEKGIYKRTEQIEYSKLANHDR